LRKESGLLRHGALDFIKALQRFFSALIPRTPPEISSQTTPLVFPLRHDYPRFQTDSSDEH
jgi:hypothetical protein